jgi:hypothetical protein
MHLALEAYERSVKGTKMYFDLITTSNVHSSHITWLANRPQLLDEYLKLPMSWYKTMVIKTPFWLPLINLCVPWT